MSQEGAKSRSKRAAGKVTAFLMSISLLRTSQCWCDSIRRCINDPNGSRIVQRQESESNSGFAVGEGEHWRWFADRVADDKGYERARAGRRAVAGFAAAVYCDVITPAGAAPWSPSSIE